MNTWFIISGAQNLSLLTSMSECVVLLFLFSSKHIPSGLVIRWHHALFNNWISIINQKSTRRTQTSNKQFICPHIVTPKPNTLITRNPFSAFVCHHILLDFEYNLEADLTPFLRDLFSVSEFLTSTQLLWSFFWLLWSWSAWTCCRWGHTCPDEGHTLLYRSFHS